MNKKCLFTTFYVPTIRSNCITVCWTDLNAYKNIYWE